VDHAAQKILTWDSAMIGAAQAHRHQFSLDAEAEPARDYYVRAGGLTKRG